MSLALSACFLFISLMQSANGLQFLNTASTPLFALPAASSSTIIVRLTSIYTSL